MRVPIAGAKTDAVVVDVHGDFVAEEGDGHDGGGRLGMVADVGKARLRGAEQDLLVLWR